MLVRIFDAHEAELAVAAGVAVVEADVGTADVADSGRLRAIRTAVPKRSRLRLRIDTAGVGSEVLQLAAEICPDELAVLGADAVRSRHILDDRPVAAPALHASVTVATDAVDTLAGLRNVVRGIVFDAPPGARLLDRTGVAELDALAGRARSNDLAFGFAGALEAADVARLVLLYPDSLTFDKAVRIGLDPNGAVDPKALEMLRALLPHAGAHSLPQGKLETDRLFVRNLVLPLSIGAYQAERSRRQRVRFSVDITVAREPVVPRDMRDVFSYDVITETIRRLAGRAHVDFVETLAEEIAASLLDHAAVLSATVTVEKLDVIDGEVGIEIHRRRPVR